MISHNLEMIYPWSFYVKNDFFKRTIFMSDIFSFNCLLLSCILILTQVHTIYDLLLLIDKVSRDSCSRISANLYSRSAADTQSQTLFQAMCGGETSEPTVYNSANEK